MDCIFCKIVTKEVPNYTVYEDEHVLAFLDIFPRVEGHTVVIPKEHGVTIFDLSSEIVGRVMQGVQKAAERVQNVLKPEGFSIGFNHGEVAGQVVPHLHFHILPRWKGDKGGNMHSIVKTEHVRPVGETAELFKK